MTTAVPDVKKKEAPAPDAFVGPPAPDAKQSAPGLPGPQPRDSGSAARGAVAAGASELTAKYLRSLESPDGDPLEELQRCSAGKKKELDEEFECYWKNADLMLKATLDQQVAVLSELAHTAGADAEAPVVVELMAAACGVLLAGVGGAVAKAVSRSAATTLAGGGSFTSGEIEVLSSAAGSIAKSSTKVAGAGLLDKLRQQERTLGVAATHRAAAIFFSGLEGAFNIENLRHRMELNYRKPAFRAAGPRAAEALATGVRAAMRLAAQEMRVQGASQWCSYLAQVSSGVTRSGTTALPDPFLAREIPGVLRLRGRAEVGGAVRITGASLPGVGANARLGLRARTLDELGLPMIVDLELVGHGSAVLQALGRHPTPRVAFGRDERGRLLVGGCGPNHTRLMALHGEQPRPTMGRPGSVVPDSSRSAALDSANALWAGMGGFRVPLG